jgi:hypothetical protein
LPIRKAGKNKITTQNNVFDTGVSVKKWKETRGSELMFGGQGENGWGVVVSDECGSSGKAMGCESKSSGSKHVRPKMRQ